MREVIHRVMEAEKEAQQILQAAQTEAERLVSEAQHQAKVDEEQVRSSVRPSVNALIDKAVQEAEIEKASQLARAVQEMDSGLRIDDQRHRSAVNFVVNCVAGFKPSG